MTKAPNEVDRHVGTRIRMRRSLLGMSQEKLGDALGITFQQVQKYEKGSNRVSASRLQGISRVLGAPIDYFYEGMAGAAEPSGGFAEGGAAPYEAETMTADALKLMRAYSAIRDPKVRRRLLDLAAALAAPEEADAPERSE